VHSFAAAGFQLRGNNDDVSSALAPVSFRCAQEDSRKGLQRIELLLRDLVNPSGAAWLDNL
jgi:hypothetical protein